MEQKQATHAQQVFNQDFVSESALKMRLDTEPILEKIEVFLRGKRNVYYQDKTGSVVQQEIVFGTPKANELGIQSLLAILQSILNPAFVQGNFNDDDFYNYMALLREDLAENMVQNANAWELKESEMGAICDMILNSLRGFVSRLRDNKERESYTNTIRTNENKQLKEGEQFVK
jgi:hypothetical protein